MASASVDRFNRGPAGLVVVLAITSRAKGVPLQCRRLKAV